MSEKIIKRKKKKVKLQKKDHFWCNLFSIREALKRGWGIGNKGMHITISKGRSTIEVDSLFKFPTGYLTGVTLKTSDEVVAIANSKTAERISYENGHPLLMHANTDVTNKTLQRLGIGS